MNLNVDLFDQHQSEPTLRQTADVDQTDQKRSVS